MERESLSNEGVQAGFTLMEMLVSISIIATLSALLYPSVSSALRRSYVAACQTQLRQIGQAIKMYQADYQTEDWPCSVADLIPHYVPGDLRLCPWEARVASEEVKRLQQTFRPPGEWSSYFTFCREAMDELLAKQGMLTFSEVMERRGERTPMVICREHREPFHLGASYPIDRHAWFFPEAPVVVLRKDGSVDLSMKGGMRATGTACASAYLGPTGGVAVGAVA
jgi:prepilin-type N-terminal cleavage/methylation domain-containing protein